MSYEDIIKNVLAEGRKLVPESEAYRICDEFDIIHPPSELVKSVEEGLASAEAIRYPVALKIVSPAIVHKSDVGGVIVGIESQAAFSDAYEQLMRNVEEKAGKVPLDGVLVQKSMPKGVEVAVGGLKDDQFGPVVMFGSGGILIEVFKDVSFRLPPLDKAEAGRQIAETKAYEVLKGLRGAPACDIDSITELVVSTGRLIFEVEEIDQIDFNPVLAYPDGCSVVDARIIVKG
ncbi:MAG: acetate--CoA ligase family protein [Thermodesulfobacteriota bacterium]|nr:acetate--CoA ligase family protein [Thermodesulfobacteriota bacterium]